MKPPFLSPGRFPWGLILSMALVAAAVIFGEPAPGPVYAQETPTFTASWSSNSLAEGGSSTLTIRNTNSNATVGDSDWIVVTLHVGRNESTADPDDIQVRDHSSNVLRPHRMSPNIHHDGGWLYLNGPVDYGDAKTNAMTVQAFNDNDGTERLSTWVYVNGYLAGSQVLNITSSGGPTLQASTVGFGASSYTATEGGSGATVTVNLDQAPGVPVTVPITRSNQGNATDADYSGVPLRAYPITLIVLGGYLRLWINFLHST